MLPDYAASLHQVCTQVCITYTPFYIAKILLLSLTRSPTKEEGSNNPRAIQPYTGEPVHVYAYHASMQYFSDADMTWAVFVLLTSSSYPSLRTISISDDGGNNKYVAYFYPYPPSNEISREATISPSSPLKTSAPFCSHLCFAVC